MMSRTRFNSRKTTHAFRSDLFRLINHPLSPGELKAFEEELGLTLPEDYKAHMLIYNGGAASCSYIFWGVPDDGINFLGFHPIKYGRTLFVERKDYLPENHLAIGRTGTGYLAMSLDEKTYGHIFVHYSEVELEFLGASFTEFLDNLTDYRAVFED